MKKLPCYAALLGISLLLIGCGAGTVAPEAPAPPSPTAPGEVSVPEPSRTPPVTSETSPSRPENAPSAEEVTAELPEKAAPASSALPADTEDKERGFPVYPGAEEMDPPPPLVSFLSIPPDLEDNWYFIADGLGEVGSWYREQAAGWMLVDERSFTPPDRPGTRNHMQYFRKEEEGLFIYLSEDPMQRAFLGVVSGPWSQIQSCGETEQPSMDGKEPPGTPPAVMENVDIDWSQAYVFEDPAGDFWLGEGSPPQMIEFSPSDMVKVSITNDDQYLYFKCELDGELPVYPLEYEGNRVEQMCIDIVANTDADASSGAVMNFVGGDLAMEAWFGSPPEADDQMYEFMQYTFFDSSGEEGVGEWRDGKKVGGGTGENYVTLQFPLADLELETGDTVEFIIFAEAESDRYHHFARDVMGTDEGWDYRVEIR